MDQSAEILVRILAGTDGIWLPVRDFTSKRPANAMCSRKTYRRFGVRWASDAAGALERKRAQLSLEGLVTTRLVKSHKPHAARTLYVRLTDAGEALARRLCGLPSLYHAVDMMRDIASMSKRPPVVAQDMWTAEIELAGLDCWGETAQYESRQLLVALEYALLPALVRGWVASGADIAGRVRYSLTDAGWAALDNAELDAGEPPKIGDGKDPEARLLYDESLCDALARLDGPALNARELGLLPLPSGLVGTPVAEVQRV